MNKLQNDHIVQVIICNIYLSHNIVLYQPQINQYLMQKDFKPKRMVYNQLFKWMGPVV